MAITAPECPACAAPLAFDPKTQQLGCKHCRANYPIEAAGVIERPIDFDNWSREEKGSSVVQQVQSVKCETCGGTTQVAANVTAGKCPFCKSPFVKPPTQVDVIRPHAVAGFTVDRDRASADLQKWIGSRRFAPKALKTEASVDKVAGMYIPLWRFTADTDTEYDGERGEHRTRTRTNSDGKTESFTETEWYGESGEVSVHFDAVDVASTKGIHPDLVEVVTGISRHDLVPFREEYLYGFNAETYELGPAEGLTDAKGKMEPEIEKEIKEDIGGDEQRIRSKSTRYSGVTFMLLLVPAWLVAYRFQGKAFQVVMDGRSGKIKGKRPFSVVKIVALIVILVALIVAIVVLVKSR